MNKQPYYITVQAGPQNGEIRQVKGDSSYDFEIKANEDEVFRLHELFEEVNTSDFETFLFRHLPGSAVDEKYGAVYDHALAEIYRTIYDLGTNETKQQIEKMGVLEAVSKLPGDQTGGNYDKEDTNEWGV